jgi:hypothetical protein
VQEIKGINQLILLYYVGRVTVHWASLERFIDLFINTLHSNPDVKTSYSNSPTRLSDKLKFLRESADNPQLSICKDPLITWIDSIDKAKETRHHIIHGHIENVETFENELEITRLLKPDSNIERITITVDDLDAHLKLIDDLWEKMGVIIDLIKSSKST